MQAAVTGTVNIGIDTGDIYRQAAQAALRQYAGFVAGYCEQALPESAEIDTRKVIQGRCLELLLLMLNRYREKALPEFLGHMARSEQRTPPEMTYRMLEPGMRNFWLRPFLQAVIGQRGIWLAHQLEGAMWTWMRRIKPENPRTLLERDRWREKDLRDFVADEQWVQMEQNLISYMGLFTPDFASYCIEELTAGCQKMRYNDSLYPDLWKLLHYRVPLSHREMMLEHAQQVPEFLNVDIEMMRETFAFRAEMIATVYEQ